MGKKFSIADYANLVTVSEMDRPEIVMIPWDKIAPNAGNFYAVEDVTDLLNAIEMQGLLSPIVVTTDRESDGYRLISGHRRHKAWGQLRKKDPEKYAAIPAIVRSFGSEAEERLALILSNSAARVLTPYEIGQQAQEVEMVFYQLKEQGFEFPGRMREHVAKAVKQSSSKLARIRAIETHLAECWRESWKGGKLNEAVAYELSQCPEELQTMIWQADPQTTAHGIPAVRKLYESGVRWAGPEGKKAGCKSCHRTAAFLRHDLADRYYPCKGERCCLKCDKATRPYDPCPRMCSKAKEARSQNIQQKKYAEEEARVNRERETVQRIRESAARLVKAADAMGVTDETAPIPTRYSATNLRELRKIADGSITPHWNYCNYLSPDEGLNVRRAAEVLGCSADYVCGLTEDPAPTGKEQRAGEGAGPYKAGGTAVSNVDHPEPVWMTGTPERLGRYLCKIDMGTGGSEYTCELKKGGWWIFGSPLMRSAKVLAWWPLPPEDPTGR